MDDVLFCGEMMQETVTQRNIYRRYHIETHQAPDIVDWPSRFKVKVGRLGLAKLLLKEIIQYRGDMEPVLSRPCLYGVFSGPVGGFLPRDRHCVGCLRCTTQYPDFVEVRPNPERQALGDTFFTAPYVNAIAYEAGEGRVPVKGAGYRGQFGGDGWDGMWTDMSEIVRPTRDGIHGREFISTAVDIGRKPNFLAFAADGGTLGETPETFSIPVPMLFDAPPRVVASRPLYEILSAAAEAVQTLAVLPLEAILEHQLTGDHLLPLVGRQAGVRLAELPFRPRLVQMDGWDEALLTQIRERWPGVLVALRLPFGDSEALIRYADAGVAVLHLTADYHGRSADGRFVYDLIREAHNVFVEAGRRDEVTLLGSGGIIAAEHVPKAIIAGLDGVVLDTPLLVALQARFFGDMTGPESTVCRLPEPLPVEWGRQRLLNLTSVWRDQLLEILGAMGLREVRRLRGEIGRAMFQKDLEREAFAGIEGYDG